MSSITSNATSLSTKEPLRSTLNSRVAASGASGRKVPTARVRKSDLLMVTTQLSIMCRAGVDLAGALANVAGDCRHPGLKQILLTVSRDVNSGMPTSLALAKHSRTFGEAYVASLAAAEASGQLTDVLDKMCRSIKNEIRTQNAIASIIAYPLVLMGVAGIVATTLIFFVLPQFSIVFKNIGRPAPPLTQMLLDGASFLKSHVLFVIGGAVVAGVFLYQLTRTDDFKKWWDRFLLRSPILKDATQSVLTGRTFRLLGSLLDSGVPLLDSLKLCRSAIKN
ncbi:type II secretion system F family protein, partial [Candidatus Woesearchaeota archaeon]|nr:type II secretion system F family protein [Candidatus Woesearchaeota archaeon]